MALWQVEAAIRGFDERLRTQALVADALVYKLMRGLNLTAPAVVPFERLFPHWAAQEDGAPQAAARRNLARLNAWCDNFEG